MTCTISWNDLLALSSLQTPASYLKAITLSWGIDIKSIAEIGVYRGKTSQMLRAFFPEAHLFLIDPWILYDEYLSNEAGPISLERLDYENAYQTVKDMFAKDQKTTLIRKTSEQASHLVPNELDLVFIDGNHSYDFVKKDIEMWLPKVKHGGIISGHDYNPYRFPQVVKAVDESFNNQAMLGSNYTWLKQKI